MDSKDQCMLFKVVVNSTREEFYCTPVYAANQNKNRLDLWKYIFDYADLVHGPWITLGDWNAIRFHGDKKGGSRVPQRMLDEFNLCLQQVSKDFVSGPKPFKMLKVWCDKREVLPLVQQAWDINVKGIPMHRLLLKLRNVKKDVKQWNKNVFGDVGEKIIQMTLKLETIQGSLLQNPTDAMLDEEQTIRDEYESAMADQEIMMAQKSILFWLWDNDKCTAYFHKKLKQHRNFNAITKIENAEGVVLTDPATISSWFVEYYQKLFSKSSSEVVCDFVPRHTLDEIENDMLEGQLPMKKSREW
ncbi:uncharacterized protein LOC132278247 [Cornus florida]|uniref:uncharacterized protein LOC132278247 n=1 Tax=Cornus florida TaxID=4283 RepID=UPI00289AE26F|nr:uncharacterized protein LOC132278247 [Cornus florida]